MPSQCQPIRPAAPATSLRSLPWALLALALLSLPAFPTPTRAETSPQRPTGGEASSTPPPTALASLHPPTGGEGSSRPLAIALASLHPPTGGEGSSRPLAIALAPLHPPTGGEGSSPPPPTALASLHPPTSAEEAPPGAVSKYGVQQGHGAPSVDAASVLPPSVEAALAAAAPRAIELRHTIHANPELSNREVETAALVAEHLRSLGLEVETGVAHTGVVGVLRGGRPGPVVGVRADMDALPVVEDTDLPFASTKTTEFLGQEVGVAHACGHDVHTAVGLGLASALAAVQDELPGTVLFLFQPAEEGPPPGERGGAELMMEEGALDDPRPEALFALHAFPDLRVGEVGWRPGPTYAAVDQFRIELRGKQSHGARPEDSVDPVVLGSQVVLALQTIVSRSLPPLEPAVLTVGIFRGGERFNIIPGSVHLEGTVRTYGDDARATVERRMRQILDGLTTAAGATYDLEYTGNAPSTINDPALSHRVRPYLESALGADAVLEVEPALVGEDFAYFARAVPGFYLRLGTTAPGTESGGLHTPTFRADDTAVPVGMRAMAALVWGYLAEAAGEGATGADEEAAAEAGP